MVAARDLSELNAQQTIEDFYKRYLNYNNTKASHSLAPKMRFSKSFKELEAQDIKTCQEKAGTDICGWGADTDIYLDTQETGPNLSYATSGIVITEPEAGKVKVALNVYPSDTSANGYYDKTIVYSMIKENGYWAVDDMSYQKHSARGDMLKEIDFYNKNPQ